MYQVRLVDTNSWSNSLNDFSKVYTMSWNGTTASYTASVGSWVAPTEYVVRYKMLSTDGWSWTPPNYGGSCTSPYTHQVKESYYNTVVAFTALANHQCHLVKQ